MRSLVETLPLNILRKDLEGRLTFANELLCRTLGKPMAEIIGKTDDDLFPPELASKYRHDDKRVLASAQPIEVVEENRNSAGEKIYVQVIKTPLHDADHRPTGLQVVFWDITARARAEAERRQAEARLETAQKGLVEASRLAGMAEVATSVLHNVGNVLNSVNVSAGVISGRMRNFKAGGIAKAVTLMREHETDLGAFFASDPKGKQLTGYLAALAEHLDRERTSVLEELELLHKNVEHIKEIVAMQQSYAQVHGVCEQVKPADLVEDALRMNAGALERHQIEVAREYAAPLPEVSVERHKVLQILINLIRNAKYACDESGRPDKRLAVQVAAAGGRIRIAMIDNGIGIPPENLTRIFNHGFTTRKNGHGFGLHSGALAAREMGGNLLVHSEGAGKGATFTLELPLLRPATEAS